MPSKRKRLGEVARRQEKTARRFTVGFTVAALVAAALTLAMLLLTVVTVQSNLAGGRYLESEQEALTGALPFAQVGGALMLLGSVLGGVFLFRRRWKASIVGGALTLAGALTLLPFTLTLQRLFAYNELSGRGLTVPELLLRHYSTLLVPLLLTAAVLFAARAQKKRDLADSADRAGEPSTVSVAEPDSE